MNEPVKLVALDLDRTTLNSQGHLSVSNRQAIISAMSIYFGDIFGSLSIF